MGTFDSLTKAIAFGPLLFLISAISLSTTALAQVEPQQEKDAFIRELMDDPARLDLKVLREEFPTVFRDFEAAHRARMEEMLASGEISSPREAYQRGLDQPPPVYRQWLASHIALLGMASDDAAIGLLMVRNDITLHLLKTDVQQCALFEMANDMRGFSRTDIELMRLMMIWTAGVIRAIKSGMSQPNPDNQATEKDYEALMESAVSMGFDQHELELAFSGELEKAPPEDQCRGSVLITVALAHMKGERRGRLARSFLTK